MPVQPPYSDQSANGYVPGSAASRRRASLSAAVERALPGQSLGMYWPISSISGASGTGAAGRASASKATSSSRTRTSWKAGTLTSSARRTSARAMREP